MSLLTAADVAYMQDTQEEAMPGTVVIERYTLTPAGDGTNYEAWAAVGTVIGRIYPQRTMGVEQVAGAQVISGTKWWATLPTIANDADYVYPQDRLFYDSRTWEVVRVNNGEMQRTAVRCELATNNEERRA